MKIVFQELRKRRRERCREDRHRRSLTRRSWKFVVVLRETVCVVRAILSLRSDSTRRADRDVYSDSLRSARSNFAVERCIVDTIERGFEIVSGSVFRSDRRAKIDEKSFGRNDID